MRRVVFYLFIIAVFLAAPLAHSPRRGRLRPLPPLRPRPRQSQPPPRPTAPCVGQLPGMAAGGFSTPETFSGDIAVILTISGTWGPLSCWRRYGPFGDALYPSSYYPFSHLCTGQQGGTPAMTRWPCWCRPPTTGGLHWKPGQPLPHPGWADPALCGFSPAKLHPDWVKYTDTGALPGPGPTRRCGST